MIADGKITVRFIGGPLEGELRDIPALWDDEKGWCAPTFWAVEEMRSPLLFRCDPLAGADGMRIWTVTYRIQWNDTDAQFVATMERREERST